MTKEEAAEAARAAAFTEIVDDGEEGRTLLHSFSHGSGMALGADWDLGNVLEFIADADSVEWVAHPLQHDLEVRGDGRLLYFAVPRPQ